MHYTKYSRIAYLTCVVCGKEQIVHVKAPGEQFSAARSAGWIIESETRPHNECCSRKCRLEWLEQHKPPV